MSENTLSRQRSFSASEGQTLSASNADSHQQESQWIDAYTKLAAAFHEKENEIVQVAQIGQALLEQNKRNEDAIEELNKHIAEKDTEITDLKKKLRIQTLLRKQNSKYEMGVKEVSVDENEEDDNGASIDSLNTSIDSINVNNANTLLQEEHNYLINSHKILQENYDKLQEDYHRIQEEYDSSSKALSKKEKQLSKEVSELRDRQIQYNEQVEALQQQIKEASQREQQLKISINQSEQTKKEMSEQMKTLEDKIISLDKIVAREFQSKTHKDSEITSLKNRIKELEASASELKQNEASLQDTVSALVKRNHTLYQEKEEIETFLQESSSQIRRNTITERDLHNATSNFAHSPSSPHHHGTFQSSLLSELEESLQEKIKAEIAQIKDTTSTNGEEDKSASTSDSTTTTDVASPQKSHSGFDSQVSESEFFFLTAAAVKVGLIMKFPHKSSLIVQVNIKKLYDQAQNENVPFHEWHNFITSSFGNIMFRDTNPSNAGVTTINNLLTNSNGENGLFTNENETKGTKDNKNAKDVNLDWLELKSAVPKNAVETMSPYPEQNELLHRLFKIFDSEFVIEYFTCDLDEQFQIRGTLFVTLEAVYFYAKSSNPNNLKIPEIKISLKFVDVTSILIKKGFLGIRSTSITIQAKNTGNVPRFTFTTFKNLDYAYEVIYKHWRNWSDSLSKSPQAVKTTDDIRTTTTTSTATPNAPAPTQAQFKKDRKKSSTWFGAN